MVKKRANGGLHAVVRRAYNDFAECVCSLSDYEGVKAFAVNDFFASRHVSEKQKVATAYAKIERNTATALELLIIMLYFAEALKAYRR